MQMPYGNIDLDECYKFHFPHGDSSNSDSDGWKEDYDAIFEKNKPPPIDILAHSDQIVPDDSKYKSVNNCSPSTSSTSAPISLVDVQSKTYSEVVKTELEINENDQSSSKKKKKKKKKKKNGANLNAVQEEINELIESTKSIDLDAIVEEVQCEVNSNILPAVDETMVLTTKSKQNKSTDNLIVAQEVREVDNSKNASSEIFNEVQCTSSASQSIEETVNINENNKRTTTNLTTKSKKKKSNKGTDQELKEVTNSKQPLLSCSNVSPVDDEDVSLKNEMTIPSDNIPQHSSTREELLNDSKNDQLSDIPSHNDNNSYIIQNAQNIVDKLVDEFSTISEVNEIFEVVEDEFVPGEIKSKKKRIRKKKNKIQNSNSNLPTEIESLNVRLSEEDECTCGYINSIYFKKYVEDVLKAKMSEYFNCILTHHAEMMRIAVARINHAKLHCKKTNGPYNFTKFDTFYEKYSIDSMENNIKVFVTIQRSLSDNALKQYTSTTTNNQENYCTPTIANQSQILATNTNKLNVMESNHMSNESSKLHLAKSNFYEGFKKLILNTMVDCSEELKINALQISINLKDKKKANKECSQIYTEQPGPSTVLDQPLCLPSKKKKKKNKSDNVFIDLDKTLIDTSCKQRTDLDIVVIKDLSKLELKTEVNDNTLISEKAPSTDIIINHSKGDGIVNDVNEIEKIANEIDKLSEKLRSFKFIKVPVKENNECTESASSINQNILISEQLYHTEEVLRYDSIKIEKMAIEIDQLSRKLRNINFSEVSTEDNYESATNINELTDTSISIIDRDLSDNKEFVYGPERSMYPRFVYTLLNTSYFQFCKLLLNIVNTMRLYFNNN